MAEVSQRTHEDRHRALVTRLATQVKPARRLWSVGARLCVWMFLGVGVLAWAGTHTTNRFIAKLSQPAYAFEVIFFAAAAIISAMLALRSAIPGRTLRTSEALLATGLVIAGII